MNYVDDSSTVISVTVTLMGSNNKEKGRNNNTNDS
jgi:hypothetical protein